MSLNGGYSTTFYGSQGVMFLSHTCTCMWHFTCTLYILILTHTHPCVHREGDALDMADFVQMYNEDGCEAVR